MKKIIFVAIATFISAFFGLFILPRTVETKRWIILEATEEEIWAEISQLDQWNSWQPWASDSSQGEVAWYGGTVSVSNVDKENLTVHFTVDYKQGEGQFIIEKMPDNLWLGCSYAFQADYAPWSRLSDWLARGELALNIDSSLQKIKNKLESN